MTNRWRVEPATLEHAFVIAERMRDADAAECRKAGVTPERAMFNSYDGSFYARTLFVDGEPMAIWGVGADLIDDTARPWLFTAKGMERHARALLKIGRLEVAEMMSRYDNLWNLVDADYRGALRFVEKLGFTLGDLVEMPGGLFRRIEKVS